MSYGRSAQAFTLTAYSCPDLAFRFVSAAFPQVIWHQQRSHWSHRSPMADHGPVQLWHKRGLGRVRRWNRGINGVILGGTSAGAGTVLTRSELGWDRTERTARHGQTLALTDLVVICARRLLNQTPRPISLCAIPLQPTSTFHPTPACDFSCGCSTLTLGPLEQIS